MLSLLSFSWFLLAAGAVAVILFLASRRLGPRSPITRTGQLDRQAQDALRHHGLRAQATITSARSANGGREYVTTAEGVDPTSGQPRRFTQHTATSIGRRGEPVT